MLIRYCSDMHLEGFSSHPLNVLEEHFLPPDGKDDNAVLVLAGDICSHKETLIGFLNYIAPRFKDVIFISGNHEYYGYDYHEWNDEVSARLSTINNLHTSLGDVNSWVIDGVRFVAGTMWADGGPVQNEQFVSQYLHDFKVIKYEGHKFTVDDMKLLNLHQVEKAKQLINMPFDGITVGISHHVPSYSFCHPRFGWIVDGGFAFNGDSIFMADNAPAVWIFGHTHDTIDKLVGNTHFVCNPAGYRQEWNTAMNNYFSAPKFINL